MPFNIKEGDQNAVDAVDFSDFTYFGGNNFIICDCYYSIH